MHLLYDNLSTFLIGVVIAITVLFVLTGLRVVPNNKVALVEKRWSRKGSVKTGFMALAGEAGFAPELLRGGIHWLMPFQFRVYKSPLVTVSQGKMGYVFARDGKSLDPKQTLAPGGFDVQDARGFLLNGGCKGPQVKILREGTYAINPALFIVFTENATYGLNLSGASELTKMSEIIRDRDGFNPVVIRGADDKIGIVTVHDGAGLTHGDIIAPVVGEDPHAANYHNNFQDPTQFMASGGRRGRQLQVLVDGTYYINRLFATVELVPKTIVEVGFVGVVISYTGEAGADLSGTDYSHGELVKKGQRGVWEEGLMPGKYAFNPFAGKVVQVPTTNFILKWEETEVSAHKYDENLCEVGLITKDAFEPWLPLSVVVHIDYRKAPLVVQRFGDIQRLVTQTLDPMVSAYFKNVAQSRTLIELIQQRSEIQTEASVGMKAKFAQYNLELEEVLIGTPSPDDNDKQIDTILTQLRSRQVAEEQIETYNQQQKAAERERTLREAQANAEAQQKLTQSAIAIQMQENEGKASLQRAIQDASKTRTAAQAEADKIRFMAQAEADRIRLLAEAEADQTARVGVAKALAIEEQVRAYGGPKFQLTQQVMDGFSAAIRESKVDVVPRIVVGSSGGNGGILETLLTTLAATHLDGDTTAAAVAASRPEAATAIRNRLLADIAAKPTTQGNGTVS